MEKRTVPANYMIWLSPLSAIALTMLCGFILFSIIGIDPFLGVYIYFVEPLTNLWSIEELIVKASPLILIATGLSICFRANIWNIGAEGQFVVGAIFGGMIPVMLGDWQNILTMPAMLMMGAIGGMALATVPAFLKTRFNVNEILTSLMLVYVAQLFLDWLVRGPWRDPEGFNFPKTVSFEHFQLLDSLWDGRVHTGVFIVLCVVIAVYVLLSRTRKGYEIIVTGQAYRAAHFAGFSAHGNIWFCFLLSGACAGLAGVIEVSGTVAQLQPNISPGYGFTAIIVAFLGRLHPLGILFAAFVLAISYIGGEGAQIVLGLSDKTAQIFQGLLLFFILGGDSLIHYRLRVVGLFSGSK
ncbi:MAG: ABC transporter permease [Pseudomonadota bacterium]